VSNIVELKGDLFHYLNKDDIFLHACNAQGNWGAGIARQFAFNFPKSYEAHKKKSNRVGKGYILDNDGYRVGCLITSKYYGLRKDSPKQILINTYNSLLSLFSSIEDDSFVVQSPKINSGLFATPWDLTSKVIERAISKFENKDITWVTREF